MKETVSDALRYHGGNINAARALFPNAPEPWIDLSTGISPIAYPTGVISPDSWTRLPELSEVAALEAAARHAYGAGQSAEIVAAPGTQALIQWLPHIFPAARVGILGFTYGEHEKCWRRSGAEVITVETLADFAAFDVGVVVNPNNPDGCFFPPDLLAATANSFADRGGLLIVDEAFMDFLGRRSSFVPSMPADGAVVLRSFGKTYGLAGLRLGFAVAPPRIATMLRGAIGPWAISGPAIAIGRRALTDDAWLADSATLLKAAAERLDRMLESAGFGIVGGTALFRLAHHQETALWFERLGRAGILTRPFSTKPDWLRFGIPALQEEWDRLAAVLRQSA